MAPPMIEEANRKLEVEMDANAGCKEEEEEEEKNVAGEVDEGGDDCKILQPQTAPAPAASLAEAEDCELEQQQQPRASTKGYLIALIEIGDSIKAYGSPADRTDCDEILEINGKSFIGADIKHSEIVKHIHECIKLRNICLRVKRAPVQLTKDSSILDVFVIGTDAHEQLNRFFKITNILANPQDLLKLTDKMEMLELNNANQTTVNNNGTFNLNQHQQIINSQQQQTQTQQLTNNQINLGPAHLYRSHQQQQQQQGLRYINNPKVSKHRELPVDVPDSFVGIAKQSPRYPPPKPHRQVSPSMPMNSLTTFNHAPSTMPYNNSNNPSNNCPPQQQQPVVPPISQSTAVNIVTHNSSLRSSIKLKQLEKSRNGQHSNYPVGQMQPAINQAFELNEDDAVVPMNTNHTQNNQLVNVKQHQAATQITKAKQSSPDLCSIYSRLQRNLNGEFADVTGDAKLVKLLSIYNTIVQTHNKQFRIPTLTSRFTTTINAQGLQEPVRYKVSDLLQSAIFLLRDEEMTNDAAELLAILCKHEVDGVCSAFDRIAQSFEFAKSSRPTSPQAVEMVPENGGVIGGMPLQQAPLYSHTNSNSNNNHHHHHPMLPQQQQQQHQHQQQQQLDDYDYAPDQVQMDIENNLYQNSLHPLTDIDLSGGTCTKTVRVEKTSNQALGATIKNDDGRVIIGRIVCGGAAHKSGLLHEDDEILEVNGVQMRGKNVNEVVDILEGMNGTLTFTVVTRNYNKPPLKSMQEKIFVRAFFNYDGENDVFIPCKELGLSFEKGEILQIIDQSDPKWWQAHREGDSEWHLAGLIPSHDHLKHREKGTNHEDITATSYPSSKKNLLSMLFNCPKGSSPRRRKKPPNIPFGPDEIPYYEEVCLYYPNEFRKRPIILVGPKMIGQREIVSKLLHDSNRFANAISHTSKPRADHERDGVDFHFVTRAQFEEAIKQGKFIECGQYQNQYYGTSLEAMKEVVKSRKTCIHLVNTPSIFNFRQGRAGAELKPFFVFVKPDDSHPEKLRNIVSTFSDSKSNIEENIKAIIAEVQMIEAHYLPYFDLVITVSDIERAYQELLFEIEKIESEPQWIPSFWQG